MSRLPVTNECPYCQLPMRPSECACGKCGVAIRADFPSVPLGSLPTEHQRFIEMFVLASGNLKEIATHAGVSYPTVRSRLDKVIAALRQQLEADRAADNGEQPTADSPTAAEIIKRI